MVEPNNRDEFRLAEERSLFPHYVEILGWSDVGWAERLHQPLGPHFGVRKMNAKEPGDLRPTWQVRLDAIRLREKHGMAVSDIAKVLSCDRRQIKYWLSDYASEIRQGDVY